MGLDTLRAAGAIGSEPRRLKLRDRRDDPTLSHAPSGVLVRWFEPGTDPPNLLHPDWLRANVPAGPLNLDALRRERSYREVNDARASAAKRRRAFLAATFDGPADASNAAP